MPAARPAAGQLPFTNNTIESHILMLYRKDPLNLSSSIVFFVPYFASLQTHVLFNDHFNRVDKISNIQGENVSRPLDKYYVEGNINFKNQCVYNSVSNQRIFLFLDVNSIQ